MKATEIKMQIIKNLLNYENVRMEATFTLNDDDTLETAFTSAREQLESAFKAAFSEEPRRTSGNDEQKQKVKIAESSNIQEKDILSLESPNLTRIMKRLSAGSLTIEQLKNEYTITDSVINYMKENNLI